MSYLDKDLLKVVGTRPVRPDGVDQVTGRRFRHGTGFLRWRPDKDPRQCTFEQLAPELRPSELKELFGT